MAGGRFNERAQRALVLAISESERMNHNYVGQEHLLLTLAGDETSTAARPFTTVGADNDRVRSVVRHVIGDGSAEAADARPRTPRMEQALAFAAKDADEFGHDEVDTGHLVLGLLDEGSGIGAGILKSLGFTVESARAGVTRLLSDEH